jgi:hypothetical protein
MNNDDEIYDPASGPDATDARTGGDNQDDNTMAAGTPSGAAGVANAELGTSGPPASAILTPEELAATEVTGGAGLDLSRVDPVVIEEQIGGPSHQ